MPSMDFLEDDNFSVSSLAASIAKAPHVPGRLGELGIFEAEGITSPRFDLEVENGTLSLVPAAERGAPGIVVDGDKRELVPFNTLHLPQRSTLTADQIVGVRAFGSETEVQTMQAVVSARQAKHRRQLDATIEHLKIGAAQGRLMDADGQTVLLDIFQRFGITRITFALDVNDPATKMKEKAQELHDLIEDQLDGVSFTGIRVELGRNLFKKFTNHKSVEKAFERYQENAHARSSNREGFEFADIIWEQYRGGVGGKRFVGDDEGVVIIEGVPDLYIIRFAPADYMETVGTMGLPYYSKIEPLSMNKGALLESQSNPICLITQPEASIKILP